LPFCALDASAVSGIMGAFTVETWFNCTTGWPKNHTLFSFTDDATVGNPFASSGVSYLFGCPVTYDPWCCIDGQVANHVASISDAGFNLSSLTDVGLNGGNPYGDLALTGSTYDFRIYSGSLSAGQVAALYGLGSDASTAAINTVVPEPSTIALLVAGIVCLFCAKAYRKS
jgi:hypothetical protein